MTVDLVVLVTILGMAIGTYVARIAGFLVVDYLPVGPFARRFLDHIPGATFAALIAPAILNGGVLEWAGVAVTAATMRLTGNVLLALVLGVLVVAGGRLLVL